MSLTLYTYNVKDIKWDFSQSKTYYKLSFYGMLISMSIVFLDMKILKTEYITKFFLILSVIFIIINLISKIWRFSPEYQKKIKTNKGILQITENEFIFRYQDKFKFSEIEILDFSFHDYYGKSIDILLESGATKSIGLENTLKIKTKNKEHSCNFELSSKAQHKLLEKTFTNLIFLDKFPKIKPKELIDYISLEIRKTEGSRNYIAKSIKNGQKSKVLMRNTCLH